MVDALSIRSWFRIGFNFLKIFYPLEPDDVPEPYLPRNHLQTASGNADMRVRPFLQIQKQLFESNPIFGAYFVQASAKAACYGRQMMNSDTIEK